MITNVIMSEEKTKQKNTEKKETNKQKITNKQFEAQFLDLQLCGI